MLGGTTTKKIVVLLLFTLLLILAFTTVTAQAVSNDRACWGQASAVFARTGEMGEHSGQQATPRLGLRNLARYLADEGFIPDDSMQSLGVFVATELKLSIEACE